MTQAHEINFLDLTPKEENQLCACEDFFAEDKKEQTFFADNCCAAVWLTANLQTAAI